ncbi:MAG: YceI family protein [Proteobacteria bacterium]|nr:YceI family protein [Pseudomonadota bacterium]
MKTILAVATFAAFALCPMAWAASWHADGKASTLTFSTVSQGAAIDGRFKTFTAIIDFDPAKLASSRFDVSITLSSADTAAEERDQMLRGTDFLDATHAPTARYTCTKFRSLGGNRYAADGTLTLRGVSKPVTLNFKWTPGTAPALVGDTTLNRLDFNVGGGQWADTSQIANAVKIHTALKLEAATK